MLRIVGILLIIFGLVLFVDAFGATSTSDRGAVLIGGLVLVIFGLFVTWRGTASKRASVKRQQEIQQAYEEQAQQRKDAIWQHESEWGADICRMVDARKLDTGMTQEMVRLAWGYPTTVDEQEKTARSSRERWVYGQPRRGANYVWFVNGRISKVKM